MEKSIEVKALSKQFGTQKAVDDISFTLRPGEIVGFLGPNGAGKSTTMKMITGYLPPSAGSVTVAGLDVSQEPLAVRRRVGYLPEANPLYYDMYVREYLEFTAGVHGLGKETKPRIEEMIRLTGLTKEAHKKIGMLSKGYKQRVGLAQAMIHRPEILILDEPTSGLDPNQILEIRDLILQMGKEKTVLLSTHIMQEVQALCTRLIIINNGRIVADDSIEKLRAAGGGKALVVSFTRPVDRKLVEQLRGVSRAEEEAPNRYRLHTADPEALRRELLEWALREHVSIDSMQEAQQSLEDVFRSYTNPQQPS